MNEEYTDSKISAVALKWVVVSDAEVPWTNSDGKYFNVKLSNLVRTLPTINLCCLQYEISF